MTQLKSCQLRPAITCLVFSEALLISTVDLTQFISAVFMTTLYMLASKVLWPCWVLAEALERLQTSRYLQLICNLKEVLTLLSSSIYSSLATTELSRLACPKVTSAQMHFNWSGWQTMTVRFTNAGAVQALMSADANFCPIEFHSYKRGCTCSEAASHSTERSYALGWV